MIWIDQKYITAACANFRNFKRKSSNLYNFSCPICKDSASNKHKARGYLYLREGKYFYRCHNCGYSNSFGKFIKDINPVLYEEYVVENFKQREKGNTPKSSFGELPSIVNTNTSLVGWFQRAQDSTEAMKFLKSRQIPQDRIKDLYFTDNLNEAKRLFKRYGDNVFAKENRIVIPVKNRQKNIVGIITRAIGKTNLRYINMKHEQNTPIIYNIENIDPSKIVYVFEGAFDSMFLKNSIAVSGSDFSKIEGLIDKTNATIIFDNQPRNEQLKHQIQRMSEEGWNICVWPEKYLKKDVNEMVVHKELAISDIEKIINENTHRGLSLKLALSSWFKV